MSLREARRDSALCLSVEGAWTARRLGALEPALLALDFSGLRQLEIDCREVVTLDLSGAWLLYDLEKRATAAGLSVSYLGDRPPTVRLVAQTLSHDGESVVTRLERPIQIGRAHV